MSYSVHHHFDPHSLNEEQAERMEKLRATAKVLAALTLQNTQCCRERSLALTNLEQAVFWMEAAVSREVH